MSEIYMLSPWGKVREQTWSGTNWGLYNAISKKVPVTDINIGSVRASLLRRIYKRLRVTSLEDFNLGLIRRRQSFVKAKDIFGNVLQFEEIIENSESVNTYIFQDLSVDYVYYMSRHCMDVFAVSNFQNIPDRYIEKRRFLQNNYYRNHCSGIFTMGQWLRKDLIERTGVDPNIVHAVGGGINLDISKIDYSHKEGRRILFVGRDFVRKGGPLTVEAFRLLRRFIPNAELYVAGPSRDPLNGSALDGYHYKGICSHEELSRLFNLCDVFCMPSLFEAYGLVFIEALCYGLPCIGRNAYEMPYFIEDGVTGKLIYSNAPEELCECMANLLSSDDYFRTVRARRDQYLHNYSWDAVADRIMTVIEQ